MKRLLEKIVRQVTVVADDSLDDNEGDNARRRPVIISLLFPTKGRQSAIANAGTTSDSLTR
jgi:hypothetical protein